MQFLNQPCSATEQSVLKICLWYEGQNWAPHIELDGQARGADHLTPSLLSILANRESCDLHAQGVTSAPKVQYHATSGKKSTHEVTCMDSCLL